ncbi:hypothetical protein ACP70R_023576 [Stipagrostis hirtigluma subsp. patula]
MVSHSWSRKMDLQYGLFLEYEGWVVASIYVSINKESLNCQPYIIRSPRKDERGREGEGQKRAKGRKAKMALSALVVWWEEWQLRILVLGSLFLQYFLCFAAPWRKHSIRPFLRFSIWLAYLGSDAVAVYALATLFNRHKNTGGEGSRALEVLWAPVLLLHLAGQDAITAYNIEDNELWRRHVLTVTSQVTVALYVFCKSWSGEDKLLRGAVLLFIAGILKCIDKPISLKGASIYSLVTQNLGEGETGSAHEVRSLEAYIVQAKKYFETIKVAQDQHSQADAVPSLAFQPYHLFVDLAYTQSSRLIILESFLGLKDPGAYMVLKAGLNSTYSRLYTKSNVHLRDEVSCKPFCSCLLRLLAIVLTFATIGLFQRSHKDYYNDSDVKVTYTLLCCTAVLEFFGFSSIGVRPPKKDAGFKEGKENPFSWPDRVAQYNLIASFARDRNPSKLLKLASFFGCKDYVDQHFYVEQCPSSSSFAITQLVIAQVKAGWKDYIQDTSTYWMFNDRRGQLTIQQERCNQELCRTLQGPFDEAVLVWHLATDICFYEVASAATDRHHKTAILCREISNYMVYLLVVHPDMLMAGSRAGIFTVARNKLQAMFRGTELPSGEGDLTREIHRKAQLLQDATAIEAFIQLASKLASQLLTMDGEKRWKVTQGVWVEMLCFSASRCRGYLHAKSLGMGGEYLTYVWLLLSHLGLESVAERQQRSHVVWQAEEAAGTQSSVESIQRSENPEEEAAAADHANEAAITGDDIV